jgi:minimal PKS chain-length factor (CLF/KS beta)
VTPASLPSDRRAVITGIGVVAPTGLDREAWWSATRAGESGIARIESFDPSRYPVTLAGEVRDFDAEDHIDQRLIKQTDRWTWMALAAAQAALDDAKFDPAEHDPYSMSVITASSSGGNEFGQREIQALWEKGPMFVGAYQSIAWFYAATTGQISIKHGMKGPSGVVLSEGAGGLEALAHSRRTIRRGVETAVSGGVEAPIGPYALTCQLGTGLLSTESDPAAAYRPFDARANGYVPGEGGAILLVESLESAQQRQAPKICGEILGYGATNDAHHWGRPAPDAEQSARAMSVALANAGIAAGDVDAVVADAFGVAEVDALEAQAIGKVFGEHAARVPVIAPKSGVGRMYAGGAALDAAAALLCMRDGTLPPIVNLDEPADGLGLDFVTGAERAGELATILVNARGFGGFNSALVLRRMS